jgi:DNA polymerase-3 subunit epsilon
VETTGLRPDTDHSISIGMVPIPAGGIRYGERWHQRVRPVGIADISTDGIRAHHILPAGLDQAPPIGGCCRNSMPDFGKARCWCTRRTSISDSCAGHSRGTIERGPHR